MRTYTCLRLAFAAHAFVGIAACLGQSNVGPGEQRFNSFIYKASHNSYERSETLDDQIDDYNVWCVELDMWWENNGCDISIEHFCASAHNAQPLAVELDEISGSVTATSRFTVIYLEMKDPTSSDPCYEDWPGRSTYRSCIYNTVASQLPLSRIYTADEFVQIDNSSWPSYQELVRRGKNWMIILDELDVGGPFNDPFFFGATGTNPPSAGLPANTVLVNINGGCDVDPGDESPGLRNERWLYRAYPGGICDLCNEQNGGYWSNALARQFNFIATNCVSDGHTYSTQTHSPAPLYVIPAVPSGDQWGTYGFPYGGVLGLYTAIARVSPMVDIRMQSGEYDVANGLTISDPMRLKTSGGLVRLK